MKAKQFKTDLDAETRASQWLANGNRYAERGNQKKADECYSKSQYWLDRANRSLGMGS